MTTLIHILADQLTPELAALRDVDRAQAVVLMAEVMAEATYVRHHKKKIAFLFAAMRHHAEALRAAGWTVDYVRLDDLDNTATLSREVARAAARHGAGAIRCVEAGEWRVLAMQQAWAAETGLP